MSNLSFNPRPLSSFVFLLSSADPFGCEQRLPRLQTLLLKVTVYTERKRGEQEEQHGERRIISDASLSFLSLFPSILSSRVKKRPAERRREKASERRRHARGMALCCAASPSGFFVSCSSLALMVGTTSGAADGGRRKRRRNESGRSA